MNLASLVSVVSDRVSELWEDGDILLSAPGEVDRALVLRQSEGKVAFFHVFNDPIGVQVFVLELDDEQKELFYSSETDDFVGLFVRLLDSLKTNVSVPFGFMGEPPVEAVALEKDSSGDLWWLRDAGGAVSVYRFVIPSGGWKML